MFCDLDTEKSVGLNLPPCLPMSKAEWGTVVALFSLGGLVGGLFGGQVCKWIGRRSTLMWTNLFLMVGAVLLAFAYSGIWLGIGRFLVGIGCGAATAAVPMYVNEVSPVQWRGTLGALHQLAIVVGVVAGQALGVPLSTVLGWRLLFGFPVVPALIQGLLFPFCVETPRYLISRGKTELAKRALYRLRGRRPGTEEEFDQLMGWETTGSANAPPSAKRSMETGRKSMHDSDTEMLVNQEGEDKETRSLSLLQLFRAPQLRKPLLLAVSAQLAQQFSGINAVILYSSAIFSTIFGGDSALIITAILGIVNLIMTLVSVVLMDKAGRRVLLLISQFGMALISALIVVALLFKWKIFTVILMMSFIGTFAIGLGPIPWMIIAELFPTDAVAPAGMIAYIVNSSSDLMTAHCSIHCRHYQLDQYVYCVPDVSHPW